MKINYQEFFECKHEGDYGAVILITNEQIVETIKVQVIIMKLSKK